VARREGLEAAVAHLAAKDITPELKAEFLEMILDGYKPDVAATLLGSTGTAFRKHRSTNSQYYDEEFAHAFADAIASDEHGTAFLERLRGKISELALEDGNVRLLEKLSMIYDPAWESLRNPDVNVNVNVLLQQAAPALSRDELERLREALVEAKKRAEIESGEVIDMPAAAA
jgi:hypothetical protein